MRREEWISFCLSYGDVYEDYPFNSPEDPDAWTVMRHCKNQKAFAFIYQRNGLCMNVKCDPLRADFLRGCYQGITPAFHMNKKHWNTIVTDTDVPDEEIKNLIDHSFDLTRPKIQRRPAKCSD